MYISKAQVMIRYFLTVHFRQVSPRRQQRDRVHYLLETGYPVWPMMTTPLVQPEYPEEEVQYEDMEGGLGIRIKQ